MQTIGGLLLLPNRSMNKSSIKWWIEGRILPPFSLLHQTLHRQIMLYEISNYLNSLLLTYILEIHYQILMY